ncbi:MAG: cation transporter [Phycisphaerales bacterium]
MSGCDCAEDAVGLEQRTLIALLTINGVMFVAEVMVGWIAESTALLADSLDMLADATVYGIALYAASRSGGTQRTAARVSGVLQIALGLGVLVEVIRRTLFGSEPTSHLMIGAGAVALVANLICLRLIAKHREGGAHMRASWIFSKNDVIANTGVIVAGLLVMALGSRVPDLVVGSIVAAVVIRGGVQIWADSSRDAGVQN